MRLGKHPKREDPRTLKMARYMTLVPPAPKPPATVDWISKIPNWEMYGNDQYGDCVIAAMAHIINQAQYFNSGKFTNFTLDQILEMYSAIGGYVIGSGPESPSDQGCDMLTALKYWKNTGFLGYKIDAFMEVDPNNAMEVEQALEYFGALFIGLQLPQAVQGMSGWPSPKNLTGAWTPGSWGGHCVPPMDYISGAEWLVTWGSKLEMADGFQKAYCDEAYVILFPGWIGPKGVTPGGLNIKQLETDLAAL